jgi:predicted lipoprotein with Yx(FWY)xxD motif
LAAATVAAAGTLLAACGGYGADGGNGYDNASAQDGAKNQAAATQSTALAVTASSRLGNIVVDGEGRTLYRFDKDTASPSSSNCEDACATAWPPVLVGEKIAVRKGLDSSLVGKVKRSDGNFQVTLGGWPLYRFAKDTKAGDTKGQGVGGTWFVSAPNGKKAAAAAQQKKKTPATPRWTGKNTIKVTADDELGKIVVNWSGRTLYRFDKDTTSPSKSKCLGACAKMWPPVKFTASLKLQGVNRKLVGSIMRADGVCQLTLGGWPLYTYAKDTKAGDTNGQGVGGTWFASTATGKKAKAQTQQEDTGGDYGY